jgi:competence protein ComEC
VPQASVLKLGEGRGNPALRRIYTLRGSLHTTVGKLFPEPEASLVSGILLGIESDIPPRLYEDFNRTGTTHIIAISGFNITLIANLIIALSRRFFGARRGLWVAGLGIGLYTLLVGADAAVLRAAVMGGLALLARYWGRESHALASLGASSMMMTLITPTVLWDIGFQLSFAATLGLILYANPFHDWTVNGLSRWLSKQHAQQYGGLIAELFLYTFAAQITTWPLTMYYFRRFSLIAFAANPIILPLQPALMILSGAATILGSLWFPLGQAFALAAWPFPALTIRIVSFISSFATGGFGLSAISAKLLIGYYTALLSISIFSTRPQWLDRPIHILQSLGTGIRKRAVWGLGLAALSICFVWQSAAHSADGLLHMHILDVGMGDAILIQSPSGEHILINGGPSPSTLMNHLGRELPLIKRQLTAVILAGIRTNQSAGLVGLANHIQIATAFISPAHGSYSYRRVKEELTDGDLGVHEVQIGQRIEMGGGAQLEFLSCGPSGVTMLVTYGHARLLIPVGLSSEELDSLIFNQGVRDTAVLILSDGGHPSVNPRRWLEITNPQLVILSVSSTAGADRPSQEVLAYLANRVILRTDKHGSISLHTDGQKLWAETERLVTR